MEFLKEARSRYRILTLINGLIPLIIIISSYFSYLEGFYFFELISIGYFICGCTELLVLSTFVSVVPDISTWTLYYGLKFVGRIETALLFINVLIFVGGSCSIIGSLFSSEDQDKGRVFWLIASILTFPLGVLAFYAFLKTRSRESEKTLRERIVTEIRKNKLPYILIIPFIIFLIFTYLIPIFRGFYITLFDYPPGELGRAFIAVEGDPLLWTLHAIMGGLQNQDPAFIGLNNFFELFSHTSRAGAFQKALNNNVFFVILFVPGTVIISLFLAVLLNDKLLKGEDTYTTIFYMPVVTSILVVSVIWLRVVFNPQSGLLTLIYQLITPFLEIIYPFLNIITFGIIPVNDLPENVNWISKNLMEIIALMSIWRRVGFDVLILLAGLKSIPDSLYEAAEIDGHGGWSKFKNITIPMLKGPLGVIIILEIINGWLVFQELYGLNVAGADNTLAIYLIYNYAEPRIMTFASTVGYFIFTLSAFISLIQRVETRGIFKIFSITCLLSVLFSIPSNRTNTVPRSLGFGEGLAWFSYDLFFLIIAFCCLLYYTIFVVIRDRDIESDLTSLRKVGFFTLFISIFFLLNGYDTLSKSGFGTTEFTQLISWENFPMLPILMLGILPLIVGMWIHFSNKYKLDQIKKYLTIGWGVFVIILWAIVLFLISEILIDVFTEKVDFFASHSLPNSMLVMVEPIALVSAIIENSNPILLGFTVILTILFLIAGIEVIRPHKYFSLSLTSFGLVIISVGIFTAFIGTFSFVLKSYIIGVILVIIGLAMLFAYKYVPIVKTTEVSRTIMTFGAFILILANLGFLLLMPLVAFLSNEIISIILTGMIMLLDIIGFLILGIGILKHKHEDKISLRIAGSCFVGWAFLALVWRFLSPIYSLFPLFGKFSLNLNLLTTLAYNLAFWFTERSVPLNLPFLEGILIPVSWIFILNGLPLLIATFYTNKVLEGSSKRLLIFGICNFLGVMMLGLPTFIGVRPGDLTDIRFLLMELGILIKVILVPILGTLTFWDIFNRLRPTSQFLSPEEQIIVQRGVITT